MPKKVHNLLKRKLIWTSEDQIPDLCFGSSKSWELKTNPDLLLILFHWVQHYAMELSAVIGKYYIYTVNIVIWTSNCG
jgi:hypothetical protein